MEVILDPNFVEAYVMKGGKFIKLRFMFDSSLVYFAILIIWKRLWLFEKLVFLICFGYVTCSKKLQNYNFSLLLKRGEINKAFFLHFVDLEIWGGSVSILGGLTFWRLSDKIQSTLEQLIFLKRGVSVWAYLRTSI